jgi:hypothetical protein
MVSLIIYNPESKIGLDQSRSFYVGLSNSAFVQVYLVSITFLLSMQRFKRKSR